MKRLLTFETFVPKNVDQRAMELQKIEAKQLVNFKLFVTQFKINLQAIQGVTSTDPQEQLFIDLLQHVTIALDQDNYPYSIFLCNQAKQYMFQYNWKNGNFCFHYNRVLIPFKTKFKMNYQTWQQFLSNQVEHHFKFKPQTISLTQAEIYNV